MMLKAFGKISPFENVLFFDAFDQKIRCAIKAVLGLKQFNKRHMAHDTCFEKLFYNNV